MTVTETQTRRAVLCLRPGQFVVTPSIDQIATRALRYLNSGFSIHLCGPAGTGKTTLAMHLANCLARPVMLIFGDDDFTSSDLIGSQSGYTHKKLMDNYIHSVLKVEDELKHNWVDSRLTMACREGFTLVYDEFNRSRPEVNSSIVLDLRSTTFYSLPWKKKFSPCRPLAINPITYKSILSFGQFSPPTQKNTVGFMPPKML